MDQSKSVNQSPNKADGSTGGNPATFTLPARKFTVEFAVGVFALVGVLAAGWLAVGLGGVRFGANSYEIFGEFDNISGLKNGASVEIAGVPIGEVREITLKDPAAIVTMEIDAHVKIREDDIASIRTKGIIGDRYVKISRGGSDNFLPSGATITDTESVVDIEDLIGKIVHSMTGEKDEKEEKGKEIK